MKKKQVAPSPSKRTLSLPHVSRQCPVIAWNSVIERTLALIPKTIPANDNRTELTVHYPPCFCLARVPWRQAPHVTKGGPSQKHVPHCAYHETSGSFYFAANQRLTLQPASTPIYAVHTPYCLRRVGWRCNARPHVSPRCLIEITFTPRGRWSQCSVGRDAEGR